MLVMATNRQTIWINGNGNGNTKFDLSFSIEIKRNFASNILKSFNT